MNSTMAPFLIFALPRSRTAWLARFLSFGDWNCSHEELRHLRGLDDIKSWLAQPCTGSAETAAAPWWRLVRKYQPDARIVVIRRPVAEVVDSLLKIDARGTIAFDPTLLMRSMQRLDAKLDQIEQRIPGVLSVKFSDLVNEASCAAIFEHCLPYQHVPEWWQRVAPLNIQCSFPAMMRYVGAYLPQMTKLATMAKQSILQDLMAKNVIPPQGISFQQESFDTFYRDGQALFAEHLVEVGESPNGFSGKNIELMRHLDQLGNVQITTARCNGRMFGYLMTIVSPSLEAPEIRSAVHTAFYASKDFPGLGLKLQRAAIETLRNNGIDEVFMRAGPRGSGPKMGSLYRRLGAANDGELFRLILRAA